MTRFWSVTKFLSLSIVTSVLLLVTSSQVFAAVTGAGKISYIDVHADAIQIALENTEGLHLESDPENCGNPKIYTLQTSHASFDALAGALLTYYYEGRDTISLEISGCHLDSPVITKLQAN